MSRSPTSSPCRRTRVASSPLARRMRRASTCSNISTQVAEEQLQLSRRTSRTMSTVRLWETRGGEGLGLEDFYDKCEDLGEGASGTVMRCRLRSGSALLDLPLRSPGPGRCDIGSGESGSNKTGSSSTTPGSNSSHDLSVASESSCAVDIDQNSYAVKQIRWPSIWQKADVRREHQEAIKQELATLISLDHPNIALIREWFEDRRDGIFFVMELCDGGSMQDYLEDKVCTPGSVEERMEHVPWLQRCFRDLSYAVSYIHSRGVVHRDLKPQNVMLKSRSLDSSVKLIDFGLAALVEGEGVGDSWQQGTMLFMAPEMFLRSGGHFTEKSDMWSMGIMLAWIASALQYGQLQHPMLSLEDGRGFDIAQYDIFCAYREQEPPNTAFLVAMPESFVGMAFALLKYEPTERASAQDCLKNSWVGEGDLSFGSLQIGSIVENVIGWSKLAESDRSILSLVASNLADEDIGDLTRAFQALDTQKIGQLTKKQLAEGLRSWRGARSSSLDGDLFAGLEANGSDTIAYHEWLCATISHTAMLSGNAVMKAFEALDSASCGKIRPAQLEPIVGEENAWDIVRRFSRSVSPSMEVSDFSMALEEIIVKRDEMSPM